MEAEVNIPKEQLKEAIIQVIKTIFDTEIPVDIYELGLIYEINVADDSSVEVVMTLTSPACPVAGSLPIEVEEKVAGVAGVKEATVELVFDPPWDQDMMSEEAMLELGLL
jgi:FeS assembly SUF system protein